MTRIENPRARDTEVLRHLYDRFNARDMEAVLAAMHQEVVWANGLEGGYVHGREGVREYWTRQWAMMDSRAEPISFSTADDGSVHVEVHLTARDRDGNLLFDRHAGHIFHFENGLITRFSIRE
jgi:ketosteroid isomerase-like protein